MRKDAVKEFVERYVDIEAAELWADETSATWSEME